MVELQCRKKLKRLNVAFTSDKQFADQAELKRRVLEMRRDGLGYKRIAGALSVGIKRVRNAIGELEQGMEENSIGTKQN